MRGVDLLGMQLRGSCDLIAAQAREMTGADWVGRPLPGTSLPGFIVWHGARIIDWGVNAVVRGVAEVGADGAWSDRIRHDLGHGAGLTDERADEAARTVRPADVAAYVETVREVVMAWIDGQVDADLDRIPDLRAACDRQPVYSSAPAWAEVAALEGLPAWQFLVRPCVGHIRTHIGELAVLRHALGAGFAGHA